MDRVLGQVEAGFSHGNRQHVLRQSLLPFLCTKGDDLDMHVFKGYYKNDYFYHYFCKIIAEEIFVNLIEIKF